MSSQVLTCSRVSPSPRVSCGEVFGMNVVRVPKSYLPETSISSSRHKDAVLMPYKIADAKVHEDPVGVSRCADRRPSLLRCLCAGRQVRRCVCAGGIRFDFRRAEHFGQKDHRHRTIRYTLTAPTRATRIPPRTMWQKPSSPPRRAVRSCLCDRRGQISVPCGRRLTRYRLFGHCSGSGRSRRFR